MPSSKLPGIEHDIWDGCLVQEGAFMQLDLKCASECRVLLMAETGLYIATQ